jgi:hypothetical protein
MTTAKYTPLSVGGTGSQGPKGDTGAAGTNGTNGAPGAPGPNVTILTHTGPPVSGDGPFLIGETALDTNGVFYVCTASGTPGTWVGVSPTGALLLTGGTMSGVIAMGAHKITGLAAGSASTDAANISNITAAQASALALAGGTMTGAIAMGANKITGLANGTAAQDAAAFGQIPVPANGYGITGNTGATPTPAVSLTQTSGVLATNKALPVNTPIDVIDTGSLAAGTYRVSMGMVGLLADPSSGISAQASVKSGTATLSGKTSAAFACSGSTGGMYCDLSTSFIVVVTVAAVIELVAVCSGGSGGTAIASGSINNLAIIDCTGWTVERIS